MQKHEQNDETQQKDTQAYDFPFTQQGFLHRRIVPTRPQRIQRQDQRRRKGRRGHSQARFQAMSCSLGKMVMDFDTRLSLASLTATRLAFGLQQVCIARCLFRYAAGLGGRIWFLSLIDFSLSSSVLLTKDFLLLHCPLTTAVHSHAHGASRSRHYRRLCRLVPAACSSTLFSPVDRALQKPPKALSQVKASSPHLSQAMQKPTPHSAR